MRALIITGTAISLTAIMAFGSAIESGPAALIGCGISMIIFGVCAAAARAYVDYI